jgi:hypothetical protein
MRGQGGTGSPPAPQSAAPQAGAPTTSQPNPPAAGAPVATPQTSCGATPSTGDSAPPPPAPTPSSAERVADLPKWAQDLIHDLRRENGGYRTSEQQQFRTLAEERATTIQRLENELTTLKREKTVGAILVEFQLEASDVEFLTAADEAGLRSQAEKLSKRVKPKAPETEAGRGSGATPPSAAPAPSPNQGAPRSYVFQTPGDVTWS